MRGCVAGNWVRDDAAMLEATLAEIVLAMPLLATVTSVGMTGAPPWPPGRPSSRSSTATVAPGGAGPGSDGEAPGRDTLTANPGRVIVCEAPLSPVMVTPLP